ncbi:MAG TPA: CvpA family protein [Chitinophagaceae bacterium]
MYIDFLFLVILVLAVFKGYSRGLIVAVFSLLAFIIGIMAAVKFSAKVAEWLQEQSGQDSPWMPFVAFVLVMVAVMLLIRLGASVIERVVKIAMMGWLNRLGGIIFYLLLYLIFFSIVLFYAEQLGVLTSQTIETSRTYPILAPVGPAIIDAIGSIIPLFKGIFEDLEDFFDHTHNAIG